jgi:hypothetical protein
MGHIIKNIALVIFSKVVIQRGANYNMLILFILKQYLL